MALTISDIAKLAGVSRATVSGVLNNSPTVSERTKTKVLAIIEKHNYRPNAIARALALKQTGVIGLLVKDISNPLYSQIAMGVEELCVDNNYSVIMGNTNTQPERELSKINLLKRRQVDGLILLPVQKGVDMGHLWELRKENYPFVLLAEVPGIQADLVRADDEKGAFEAVDHLIKLGRRRIGYICGPETAMASDRRLEGYRRALIENNLVPREDLVITCGWRLEHGYQAGLRLREGNNPMPDALFCYNDSVALGLIRALTEGQIDVPDDVAVVGFDDAPTSGFLETALTTVAQPAHRIGYRAAQVLLDRIHAKNNSSPFQSIFLETHLVVRESCGANRKGTVSHQLNPKPNHDLIKTNREDLF
jgi:DNA-binding LacI/PurR family transcriptional regulator